MNFFYLTCFFLSFHHLLSICPSFFFKHIYSHNYLLFVPFLFIYSLSTFTISFIRFYKPFFPSITLFLSFFFLAFFLPFILFSLLLLFYFKSLSIAYFWKQFSLLSLSYCYFHSFNLYVDLLPIFFVRFSTYHHFLLLTFSCKWSYI